MMHLETAINIATNLNYPVDLYVNKKKVALIKNINGLFEVINILLRRGVKRKDIYIFEYEDVEYEEIINS